MFGWSRSATRSSKPPDENGAPKRRGPFGPLRLSRRLGNFLAHVLESDGLRLARTTLGHKVVARVACLVQGEHVDRVVLAGAEVLGDVDGEAEVGRGRLQVSVCTRGKPVAGGTIRDHAGAVVRQFRLRVVRLDQTALDVVEAD